MMAFGQGALESTDHHCYQYCNQSLYYLVRNAKNPITHVASRTRCVMNLHSLYLALVGDAELTRSMSS